MSRIYVNTFGILKIVCFHFIDVRRWLPIVIFNIQSYAWIVRVFELITNVSNVYAWSFSTWHLFHFAIIYVYTNTYTYMQFCIVVAYIIINFSCKNSMMDQNEQHQMNFAKLSLKLNWTRRPSTRPKCVRLFRFVVFFVCVFFLYSLLRVSFNEKDKSIDVVCTHVHIASNLWS